MDVLLGLAQADGHPSAWPWAGLRAYHQRGVETPVEPTPKGLSALTSGRGPGRPLILFTAPRGHSPGTTATEDWGAWEMSGGRGTQALRVSDTLVLSLEGP